MSADNKESTPVKQETFSIPIKTDNKREEHNFRSGDKVWFTLRFGDAPRYEGIVVDAYWQADVETTEKIVRFAVLLSPGSTERDLTIKRVENSIELSAASGVIQDVKKSAMVVPEQMMFTISSDTPPTIGTLVDHNVSGYSFFVRRELADAVEGWKWLCDKPVVKAVIKASRPTYRIRGICSGVSLADLEAGSGQMYSGIQESLISMRAE